MENHNPHGPAEGQQTQVQAQNVTDTTSRYVFTWRSTGLTAGAKTIDDMIAALQGATDALRMLKEAGVVLHTEASTGDDVRLITTDPAVAQRFWFHREEEKQQEAQHEMPPGGHTGAVATEGKSQEGTSPM